MRTKNHKRDFLDYVLYHFDFEDRVAVWILNFIKAHPNIIDCVSFSDMTIDRRLRIAEKTTGRPTLVLEKKSIVTTDGEVILHELNSNDMEPVFLEFVFSTPNKRYDEMKNSERDSNQGHIHDQIKVLEEQIDTALMNNDRDLFYRLTEELKNRKTCER
ncbi:MAG TPA: YpiB family protein [Candidatus Salinicoccus merdavium]|nr:YpiB family protein [Candidatus Salinicoccus merdavium]